MHNLSGALLMFVHDSNPRGLWTAIVTPHILDHTVKRAYLWVLYLDQGPGTLSIKQWISATP